jgi:hypothetical protein
MSFSASTKQKQTTEISPSFSQHNEISISAYVQFRNEWVEGFVFLDEGYITRCQFPDIQAGMTTLQARIYQTKKPSVLNPNNPMAVNNNFTHFVDIPNYGRAYFSM